MAEPEQNEESDLPDRFGPKFGLLFTRENADRLIKQELDMTIKSFRSIDTGYNNLIFIIETNETKQEFVLKISGRHWKEIKTEVEAKALDMINSLTTIPVPKVINYSSNPSNEYGVEWILMTRCPGEILGDLIDENRLNFDALQSIIRDLAEFVAQMHFQIPRVDQIGTFRMNSEIGADLNGRGPWKNYPEFLLSRVQGQISVLEESDIFYSIRHSMIEAIEQFQKFNIELFKNLPLVFSHGDLHVQNILVSMENPENPRITAILDWEWAGSFPCSEEYFTSFHYFLRHEDERIRTYFFDQLEERGIPTPRTIHRFDLLEKFDRFFTNLAPWELTDLVNPEDPTAEKRLKEAVSIVKSTLENLRDELSEKKTVC